MKRFMTVFCLSAALIIGKCICIPVYTVSASQPEELCETEEQREPVKEVIKESIATEKNVETKEAVEENKEESENDFSEKSLDDEETALREKETKDDDMQALEIEETVEDEAIESDKQETDPDEERKEDDNIRERKACLQVPQKLGITLDPFEINGKGQIYSEQYVIKNAGKAGGVLSLSELICEAGEDSGIVIKTDKKGLNEAEKKFVYIKIVFGNGDAITLSPKKSTYEIWLDAGEELTFWYSGEINENAVQNWKEHDLTIGMLYSWNTENTEED